MNFKNYFTKKLHNSSIIKNHLFLFIILISISVFSQKKLNSVTSSFLKSNSYLHELQIEKFFLHTNKTVYMPGEKVWFKAYVVNDLDNKPSVSTTNLHLNVYDANKKIISNHLFLVKDGTTHGDILLSKELAAGNYFIELTTQWNQNFEDNASITKIEVVSNLESTSTLSENINIKKFELKFFPESNLFLENIENTIAFSAQNNSTPININGDIIDNKTGIIVAKINSNYLGLGSFKLYNRPNRSYTAFVNYNGLQKKFTLPKTNSKGIIVKKNEKQLDNKTIDLVLKTNETTIQSIAGDYVFAVLHRNGRQNVYVPIKLKKKYINYSFTILKDNLFNGVNTITLFNQQNEPISETSFYHKTDSQMSLNISKVAEEQNSLTLNFNLQNKLSKTNLSISILPQETKMYRNKSTITSSFLIAPYLDGTHNDIPKFLASKNSQKNIDLLLMTNAKKNSLSYKKKADYQKNYVILAENGMSIKGNVSANVKDLNGYKVMLSSIENELLLIDTIGNSNKFSFENLYLKKPAKYKLALLDKNGAIIKTGFRLSTNLILYDVPEELNKHIETTSPYKITSTNLDYDYLPLLEDMTILDEVEVTGHQKRLNELEKAGYVPDVFDSSFADIHLIEERDHAITIFDFLQRLPGIKIIGDPYLSFVIQSRRGRTSISKKASPNMAIVIDGVLMEDTESLLARMADDFIAVSVNNNGARLGVRGQNGFVNFTTRQYFNNGTSNPVNKDIITSETDLGFDTPNNYENEFMQFTNNISKKYYGTIDWIPNFEIRPTTANYLKFNTNGYKKFKVIVNGMNENGNFIYKEIDMSLNDN